MKITPKRISLYCKIDVPDHSSPIMFYIYKDSGKEADTGDYYEDFPLPVKRLIAVFRQALTEYLYITT